MEWQTLLTAKRLGSSGVSDKYAFASDYKRIVTSPSFRRLQDKTQIFPLERNDFVHTRLTHSLEVQMIATQLLQSIFDKFEQQEDGIKKDMLKYQSDIFRILDCASLLHDIGNPPFGHFGETIIRQWFKENLRHTLEYKKYPFVEDFMTSHYVHDLYQFEGNAQALRIITKLHDFSGRHGMNLTYPTLNTIIKYQRAAHEYLDKNNKDKKIGYYQAEKEIYNEIVDTLGTRGVRHPLTYVLEAADDIAYITADIEDGLAKSVVTRSDLKRFLIEELDDQLVESEQRIIDALAKERFNVNTLFVDIRNVLIQAAVDNFDQHYHQIMVGEYRNDLFKGSSAERIYHTLRHFTEKNIFTDRNILKQEIKGDTVLSYLLDKFVTAVINYDFVNDKARQGTSALDEKYIAIISSSLKKACRLASKDKSPIEQLYYKLLLVTDFISGMTDSYAQNLYLELNGRK